MIKFEIVKFVSANIKALKVQLANSFLIKFVAFYKIVFTSIVKFPWTLKRVLKFKSKGSSQAQMIKVDNFEENCPLLS